METQGAGDEKPAQYKINGTENGVKRGGGLKEGKTTKTLQKKN